MSCYEVAALRLSIHTLLGDRPAQERQHEEQELGELLTKPGALRALAQAGSLAQMRSALDAASLELEQRVADQDPSETSHGYNRALVLTVKRTQRDLARMAADLERFYQDLDEAHHALHEIFPESD